MIASPNTKEYRIIVRQLAVKQIGEKSMISIVRNLLSKYSLPTACEILPQRKIGKIYSENQ